MREGMDMSGKFAAREVAIFTALFGFGFGFAADAQAPKAKIETVVVTAERRAENLQKSPLAATVLSGSDLKKKAVDSVEALQFATPALTVNKFGNGNNFNIRGIGKGENNIQTPSGVVTYRDGIPVIPGFIQDEPYFDIDNIQVLRGPQGTFGGTNATGGVVYITEQNPDLNRRGGYAQGEVGNYTDVGFEGAANVPLTDDLAARMALQSERRDSFWHIIPSAGFSGHPGQLGEINGRVSLLWQPIQPLQVLFKSDYSHVDQGGVPGDPIGSPNDEFTIGNNTHNRLIDKVSRNVLDVKYTFESGISVRSLSGFQYGRSDESIDVDGTNTIGFNFSALGKLKIYSEEVDILSPDTGPFKWVVGGFFSHGNAVLPNKGGFDIGAPPGTVDIVLTYHTRTQSEAGFGQVTYDFTPEFQIQAGARFNNSTTDINDFQQTLLFRSIPIPGTTFACPSTIPPNNCSGHEEDSKLTGKVALNWTPDDDNFLYVFFATGHKNGGLNTTNTDPASQHIIRPEDLRNVEAGWKATLADGHITSQLDGFWNDYSRFQVTFTDPVTLVGAIGNIPSAKSMGVELQGQGTWDHFSFDAGAAYIHSRIGHFLAIDTRLTALQPAPRLVNVSGNELPDTPNWTFNAGAQYAVPLRNGDTLTPRVDIAYVGGQWASIFESEDPQLLDRLRERTIVNAQLAYDWGDGWDATAFATNLFDLHYVANHNVGAPLPVLRYAGPPRQFGLRVTKFF
jgi:iron complex outermembrane receptor protein